LSELTAPVLVPVAVDRAYSYRLPDAMPLPAGTIVRVPLGNREVVGAVWDLSLIHI